MKVIDKHAPLRKRSVKNSAPWIDDDDDDVAKRSCDRCSKIRDSHGWEILLQARKAYKAKPHQGKGFTLKERICTSTNDSKNIIVIKSKHSLKYVESDGYFITKPYELTNDLNGFFIKESGEFKI